MKQMSLPCAIEGMQTLLFKITIKPHHFEKSKDPSIWPYCVVVRLYKYFNANNRNKNNPGKSVCTRFAGYLSCIKWLQDEYKSKDSVYNSDLKHKVKIFVYSRIILGDTSIDILSLNDVDLVTSDIVRKVAEPVRANRNGPVFTLN